MKTTRQALGMYNVFRTRLFKICDDIHTQCKCMGGHEYYPRNVFDNSTEREKLEALRVEAHKAVDLLVDRYYEACVGETLSQSGEPR